MISINFFIIESKGQVLRKHFYRKPCSSKTKKVLQKFKCWCRVRNSEFSYSSCGVFEKMRIRKFLRKRQNMYLCGSVYGCWTRQKLLNTNRRTIDLSGIFKDAKSFTVVQNCVIVGIIYMVCKLYWNGVQMQNCFDVKCPTVIALFSWAVKISIFKRRT